MHRETALVYERKRTLERKRAGQRQTAVFRERMRGADHRPVLGGGIAGNADLQRRQLLLLNQSIDRRARQSARLRRLAN